MPRETSPATLPVELTEGGVSVEYLDGREVFYHGVPRPVEEHLRVPPGKNLHVLVTDGEGTEGALFYVDDRKTDPEILEQSGVGSALLSTGERTQLFPGVEVERDGHAHVVEADVGTADGRVFVFAEDEFGEAAYEFVEDADEESTDEQTADGSTAERTTEEESTDESAGFGADGGGATGG